MKQKRNEGVREGKRQRAGMSEREAEGNRKTERKSKQQQQRDTKREKRDRERHVWRSKAPSLGGERSGLSFNRNVKASTP